MDSHQRYWEERIRNSDKFSSTGVAGNPRAINRRAKQRFAQIVLSELDERSVDLASARVLSAGCGTGLVSENIAERVASLIGFDFSAEAIETVRNQNPIGDYTRASISDIPFCAEFDVVTAFSVLYHLIDDDVWSSAIAELAEVTTLGGYLLLRINWSDEYVGSQTTDSHFYDRPANRYRDQFKNNSLILREVVDLPIKPKFYDEFGQLPASGLFKRLVAPLILAGELFTYHENSLVILQKQ